jgi:sugar/nucleoside kinase (ribokinase family)
MQYLCGKFFYRMKILGMGNALVDVLVRLKSGKTLAELNLAKGSMQLVDVEQRDHIFSKIARLKQEMTAGGSASNTMAALGKIGMEVGFIGKVGFDSYGKFYMNDMKCAGVTSHIIQKPSPSGTATVLITPDRERTFATYLGVSAELSVEDLSEYTFRKYDYFYVEGYMVQNPVLIEKAMRMAKSLGMKIVIDMASYNVVEAHKEFFWELIDKYVDIVFANKEEAKALTGLEDPEAALRMIAGKTNIAVVKLGADGSMAMQGNQVAPMVAMPVQVVDTTAAGDYYAAGFLYGLSQKGSLEYCAMLGSAMSAFIIRVIGTRMNEDQWEEVAFFMNKIVKKEY